MDAYTGAILIEPEYPQISENGVVNAASFQPGPVSPGMLASVFGGAMGPAEPGLAATEFDPSTGRLPTSLASVIVTFDGVPAPLFFVLDRQLNVQVPFEVRGRQTVEVIVRTDSLESAPFTVPVAEARPALFALQGGTGQVVAVLPDGSINTPANRRRT